MDWMLNELTQRGEVPHTIYLGARQMVLFFDACGAGRPGTEAPHKGGGFYYRVPVALYNFHADAIVISTRHPE